MLGSALGEVVAALGRVKPTIWILRSLASDTQDETSTVSLLASFEAASFLGVSVGFMTEQQLQNATVSDHEQQQQQQPEVVLVPNSTFVEDATVAALQRRPRGSVALVTNTTAACLGFEPSGVVRPTTHNYPDRHSELPEIYLRTAGWTGWASYDVEIGSAE